MIIIKLTGGIGNQMFQYAFGRYLSKVLDQELFLNIEIYDLGLSNRSYDLNIFELANVKVGNSNDVIDIITNSGQSISQIIEKSFEYDELIVEYLLQYNKIKKKQTHFVLIGYWQSEKYFKTIYHLLFKDFKFKNPLKPKWAKINNIIKGTNSIMLNVRRGDYLDKLDYHGVVKDEYINRSILYMEKNVKDPYFFIFSDDMDWCKKNIKMNNNIMFVGEEYYDPQYQYYLQLMVNCKHFIIANSTFAWWSAYLSQNNDKIVIAPKNWFYDKSINTKDIIPDNWIKI